MARRVAKEPGNGRLRHWRDLKRAQRMLLAFAALSVLLAGRVVHIQWYARQFYLDVAPIEPGKERELQGKRGRILDHQYRVLAESVTTATVWADPLRVQRWATQQEPSPDLSPGSLLHNEALNQVATAISAALDLPRDTVLRRLCRRSEYVVLARRADTDRASKVRALKIPGIYLELTERRDYPFGSLAAAAIGYCNAQQEPSGGVERWFRHVTEGERVWEPARYDFWDRQILGSTMGARTYARAGKDLVTTLDLPTQQVVEDALTECVATRRPAGANVVVMSCHDGSILALACRPTFDPNCISSARGPSAPVTPQQLVNRAVSNPMEPGSTFKLLTIAAALEYGVISETSTFYCRGTENLGGRPLRCWGEWARKGHGALTPKDILANSCNLGAAKIALALGPQRLHNFLRRCGIGDYPRAGFPEEHPGRLRDWRTMRTRDLACLGFGQGVLVSDVQMAAAVCALMNGGLLYQPHIVSGYISPEENDYYETRPKVLRRVCSEKTSAIIRRMARHVVEHGTGKPASIPGVAVGGKTATAQILGPRGVLSGPNDFVMGFVLAAPVDRRADFVIVVTVERPQVGEHGSEVAAPIARRIALHLLSQPGLFPRWDKAKGSASQG